MSASLARNAIDRLNREIALLRGKIADESRKESDATTKIGRAQERARRTTSPGTLNSALKDVQRARSDVERATKNRATHEKAIAAKSKELLRHQVALSRAEDAERKKHAQSARRAEEARERRIADLERELEAGRLARLTHEITATTDTIGDACDCFISHVSEDKEGFVRSLAAALAERGVTFFFDEISIGWGDSLRQRIDVGLARSKFGIVVLSEAFFRKKWTKKELDGLFQLEVAGRTKILPIWHRVTKDEVMGFSPMLADKAALNTTDYTVSEIADKLLELTR